MTVIGWTVLVVVVVVELVVVDVVVVEVVAKKKLSFSQKNKLLTIIIGKCGTYSDCTCLIIIISILHHINITAAL